MQASSASLQSETAVRHDATQKPPSPQLTPQRDTSTNPAPSASKTPSSKPVNVYLTAAHAHRRTGAGYVWSASDAARLREEFRIVGDLVGTLPKHTAQNQYLTVPLALSYVELEFGARRGFIRLLRDERALDYTAPSRADVLAFYENRRADEETHADESLAHQARQRARRAAAAPNGATGAKRGREPENANGAEGERPAKLARVAHNGGVLSRVAGAFLHTMHYLFPRFVGPPDDDGDTARAEEERAAAAEREAAAEKVRQMRLEKEREEEAARVAAEEREQMEAARFASETERRRQQAKMSTLVVTPTAAVERVGQETVLEAAKAKGISETQLRQRVAVFADLYDKGYAMSCGAKFGADFLAYAGDPLLVHASLAVIVMDEKESVSMLDVVALGRLGDSTKKRTVLAYVHGDVNAAYEVRYVGVQWEETLP